MPLPDSDWLDATLDWLANGWWSLNGWQLLLVTLLLTHITIASEIGRAHV